MNKGGILSCGNNIACNTQRFQPKYKLNGRSYFFKSTAVQLLSNQHPGYEVRHVVARKRIDSKKANAEKNKRTKYYREIKHAWDRIFADARRNFDARN
jgi:hypothetical protein